MRWAWDDRARRGALALGLVTGLGTFDLLDDALPTRLVAAGGAAVLGAAFALGWWMLRSAARAQEQAVGRARIVAAAGQELLGLDDLADVRAVVQRASTQLCRVTPGLAPAPDDSAGPVAGDDVPEDVPPLLTSLSAQHALAERGCRAHGELAHQPRHDEMTGLPNRTLLFRELEHALDDARAGRRSPVVLMIIDLDGFKGVNDTYGHAAGDAVLVEIGRRLRGLLRNTGLAARLGSDEFAVLVSGFAPDSATELAERLWARLHDPIELPDDVSRVSVGASIGLAVAGATTDAGTLMGLADVAMYAAKISGAGGVEVFPADNRPVTATRSFPVAH